jgi:hypothetical protein
MMAEPAFDKQKPMRRPGTLAEVARAVSAGRQSFNDALAEFLDEFYMRDERRAEMIAEEPPLMFEPRQDAYLGAVGEHLARRWRLPIPSWTEAPSRFLKQAFFATPLEDLKAMLIVESPLAFRRRMIFVEAEPLRRARLPAARARAGEGRLAPHRNAALGSPDEERGR